MAQTLPKTTIPRTKGAREQFWVDHLRALREQDQPLSAYAQAHGLSPGLLYRARSRLRRRALVSEPEFTAPRRSCRCASRPRVRRGACICPTAAASRSPSTPSARCVPRCSNARARCHPRVPAHATPRDATPRPRRGAQERARNCTGVQRPRTRVAQHQGHGDECPRSQRHRRRREARTQPAHPRGAVGLHAAAGVALRLPAMDSSRTDAECGHVDAENRKGKAFRCIRCARVDDADVNAAKVMRQRALRWLALKSA